MRINRITTFHPELSSGWALLKNIFWVHILLFAGVILLWNNALQVTDPNRMTDIGLISVLPWTFYAALLLLTVSFVLSLQRKPLNVFLVAAHVVMFIFILHGTPQLLYGTLRYSWAWKHVGIVDYIQRHGSVDPTIRYLNAYHNWPGFFALGAMLTDLSGFASSLSFAGWGPVFFNLLDLGALLIILKALTEDRRLIWLSVWFFFLTNWIGQDYFSPQAFTYFLYLITLGVVLTWFRARRVPSPASIRKLIRFDRLASGYHYIVRRGLPPEDGTLEASPSQRAGLMGILILIFALIASSHQLTPLMAISALTVLVIFQVTNTRSLPVLMAVLTVAWIIYMAVGFLHGNLYWVVQSIGSLFNNFNTTLINLAEASPGQVFVAHVDRALSLGIWALAAIGLFRRLRQGAWDLSAVLLAASPLPLLAANAYGGEMLFRVYFFGLPFIAFLAAGAVFPAIKAGVRPITTLITFALSGLLIFGFLFAYYGKESMFYFSPNEVAAAQYLNQIAPKGALFVDGSWDWPLQYRNYEFYNYLSIADLPKDERLNVINHPVSALAGMMDDAPSDATLYPSAQLQKDATAGESADSDDYPVAYLIITRSQKAHLQMSGLMSVESLDQIQQALIQSGRFKVIFSNPDAMILQLTDPSEGSQP